MSIAFVQRGRGPPSPAQIQKMLDENSHLIQTIQEHQNKGRVQECMHYQQILHRNLVYLASLADANQNIQALLPPPQGLSGGHSMHGGPSGPQQPVGGQQPSMPMPEMMGNGPNSATSPPVGGGNSGATTTGGIAAGAGGPPGPPQMGAFGPQQVPPAGNPNQYGSRGPQQMMQGQQRPGANPGPQQYPRGPQGYPGSQQQPPYSSQQYSSQSQTSPQVS
ncbi:hypothetical protein J437_LFUL011397 [Ladona fulva]|uniref:SS18 N-terminal domain-containing protein n=1 Tax=Ladona fulva TaxID=123851 RepID=A0A8K0KGJ9_LADFU|nr:hypothetical protein J437_LFUL011397 [Ladona fulva]